MKKVRVEILASQISKRLRKIPKRLEKLLRERDSLEIRLSVLERIIKAKHETNKAID